MRNSLLIFLFLLGCTAVAEVAPGKYFIRFTDKNGTPYSVNEPGAFLSQRAIDRRNAQGIVVTEEDLPVNPDYVTAISDLGVTVLTRSKWFNGITIYTDDPSKITAISAFPFVLQVEKSSGSGTPGIVQNKFDSDKIHTGVPAGSGTKSASATDYGASFNQIHQLNGDLLHNRGYRGEGMMVAVLDAGFTNVDNNPVFDSLRNEGRLLGTRDFVNPGGNVFLEHPHGAEVLSTMTGNLPGYLVGTAPKASYWLLRSEDAPTEYLVEEYNWVSAAEFADSVGADVINSSLGYTEFDDPAMNHTCFDMNGSTTPITRGANIAASKGIVVVNSAGNSGGSSWMCVGAPADATEIFAVAAVDEFGWYAGFSSTGTVNGSYVKPNVAAQGAATVVSLPDGTIVTGNGTSFASPVLAGLVTCLKQAHPEADRTAIMDAIEASASQYANPDIFLGYGLPNFDQAFVTLGIPARSAGGGATAYPNPFGNSLQVRYTTACSGDLVIELFDRQGRRVLSETRTGIASGENMLTLTVPDGTATGLYLLKLSDARGSETLRLIHH